MIAIDRLSIREAQQAVVRCQDADVLKTLLEREKREPVRCCIADQINLLRRIAADAAKVRRV